MVISVLVVSDAETLTATATPSITPAAFASTATIGLQLSNCYSYNIYNSYCHYHFSFPLVSSKEFLFKCLQSAATCLSCLSRVGATQRTESSLDENVFRVIENSDENCCLRRLHRRLEFRNGGSLLKNFFSLLIPKQRCFSVLILDGIAADDSARIFCLPPYAAA